MRRLTAVLLAVVPVVASVTPATAAEAQRGLPHGDRRHLPITVVEVGGSGSGIVQFGLSERGHVLMSEILHPDDSGLTRWHTIEWYRGRSVDLGTLGSSGSWLDVASSGQADRLNDRDQVTGTSETATGAWHAFLWRNAMMTDIGAIASPSDSAAYAINERDQVLGARRDTDQAVLWETHNRR